MSEQNAPERAPCAAFREEIPLLAVGALDRERTVLLEKHLTTCPSCKASYETHCRVLQTVKKESDPERPLDTEGVLARLRERIGKTPTRGKAGDASQKEHPKALIALIAAISAAVLALLLFPRPNQPDPDIEPQPDDAVVYSSRSPDGRKLKNGESYKTGSTSARFLIGKVELRLKANSELLLKKNGIELLSGTVAISVPTNTPFETSVPAARAEVTANAKTRFVVELGRDGNAEITVAEGAVTLAHTKGQTSIAAGKRAYFSTEGLIGKAMETDPRIAFKWLTGELYKGLSLKLTTLRPARVVLELKNASEGPIRVTGYHPLGVSYQLEVKRPGSTSPEFVKLAPSALRLKRASGVVESVRETRGQRVIEPDDSFELEMDLSPELREPGTYRVSAVYLGFGPSGGIAAELGLLLRSNEVKIIIEPDSSVTK